MISETLSPPRRMTILDALQLTSGIDPTIAIQVLAHERRNRPRLNLDAVALEFNIRPNLERRIALVGVKSGRMQSQYPNRSNGPRKRRV